MKITSGRELKVAKTFLLSALLVLVLSGCASASSGETPKSPAWQAGYDLQQSQAAELIGNTAEAFAYCSTIQSALFVTDNGTEIEDYVAGCLAYVNSSPDPLDGVGDDTSDFENSGDTSILARLSSADSTTWERDKFQDTTGSNVEEVIQGNSEQDESVCAVWVYPDITYAQAEFSDGSFDGFNRPYWVGEDEISGKGIVFVADSESDTCAVDYQSSTGLTLG